MSEAVPAQPATIDNRLFVLVLQHPQERHEPRATAALAVAALRRARLVAGLSWPNLSRALGRTADPKRWGVLYLGSARPAELAEALPQRRGLILLDRAGAVVADPDRILRSLEGLVLLDGSWSQAKTLWWRNPWLLKLHRVVLNPPAPGRLGQVRREPRRDALSTLEAAALALRELGEAAAADALLARLVPLIAAARRPAQREASA